MISYSLDKDIPLQKIVDDIIRLIQQEAKDHKNQVLCISIKNIIYEANGLIPKIEYKGS